ncbi:GNAT family N-acetyltransferase [bacterium]|nr:GNAT family N-acetyltransferase [bacterium]
MSAENLSPACAPRAELALQSLPIQLETERLVLQPFRTSDAKALATSAGVYSVARYTLGIPLPYTTAAAREWISNLASRQLAGHEQMYALRVRAQRPAVKPQLANNILIGGISVSLEREHFRCEIGYWLSEPSRGHGYMQEALRALIPALFEANLQRIYGLCFSDNQSSQRLLATLGFAREGCLRGHIWKWGEACDATSFGLTHKRFQRIRKAYQYSY